MAKKPRSLPKRSSKPVCVVVGGGGHAKVVLDSLIQSGAAVIKGIVDADSKLWGKKLLGVPVLGGDDKLSALKKGGVTHFVMGMGSVGDSTLRKKLFENCLAHNLKPLVVVHPAAVVSRFSDIDGGTVVLPRAVVNANAKIGKNVIVNSNSSVEHDCVIGDHVHIATAACLAGSVKVGDGAHIGAGAVVRQNISIGEGAVVGAGAVVVKDVEPRTTVIGSPARVV